MKIRANDDVLVITGKDRGKHGRVVTVFKRNNTVIIEGVNMITRHLRRNPQNPQAGGRVQKPAPIHVSNVMVWSGEEKRATRLRYEGKGREKRRVAIKSGAPIKGLSRRARRKQSDDQGDSEKDE